jgi:hypothetical protein
VSNAASSAMQFASCSGICIIAGIVAYVACRGR